jgi:uncharacterized protein DUF6894
VRSRENNADVAVLFAHQEWRRTADGPGGSNLTSLEAAREEAIGGARQLISQAVLTGSPIGMQRSIQIDDADGRTLLTVPFTAAINSSDTL